MAKLNLLEKGKRANGLLLVIPEKLNNLEKAVRNIEGLEIEKANLLHTYEVLKNRHILFLKDSLDVLSKTFLK